MRRIEGLSVVFLLVVTLAGAVQWCLECPYAYDDWIYSHVLCPRECEWQAGAFEPAISNWAQAWESITGRYGFVGGDARLSNAAHILWVPVGHGPEAVFCGFMMAVMLYLMAAVAGSSAKPRFLTVLAACALFWTAFPWSNRMMAMVYQANYVWPSVLVLCLMVLVRRLPGAGRKEAVLTVLFAFVAGMFHEGFTAVMLAYVLVRWVQSGYDRRIMCVELALFVGFVVLAVFGALGRASGDEALSSGSTRLRELPRIVLQYWPYWLACLLGLSAYLRKDKHSLDRWAAPMLAGFVCLCMAVVLGRSDRTLWPGLLMAAIVLTDAAGRYSSKRLRPAVAVASAASVALYCFWLFGLVRWQRVLGREENAAFSVVGKSDSGLVFGDYTPDKDVPWWYMGIVRHPLESDFGVRAAIMNLLKNREHILVLPRVLEGKRFSEWPLIPGTAGARGIWPMIAMNDSCWTQLSVAFSSPVNDAPVDLLLVRAKYGKSGGFQIERDVVWGAVFSPADSCDVYRAYIVPGEMLWRRGVSRIDTVASD